MNKPHALLNLCMITFDNFKDLVEFYEKFKLFLFPRESSPKRQPSGLFAGKNCGKLFIFLCENEIFVKIFPIKLAKLFVRL